MDSLVERRTSEALRAYVAGDSSEPVVLSAFRDVAMDDRDAILSRHRVELAAIDAPRLLIAESLLLPFDRRRA